MISVKKCVMLHDIGHGGLRELFGGIGGKEQAYTTIWMCISKGNAKKQTTESNETKTKKIKKINRKK